MIVPSIFSDIDDDDDSITDHVVTDHIALDYNYRRFCVDRGVWYVKNIFYWNNNNYNNCYCHEPEQVLPIVPDSYNVSLPNVLFNNIESYWKLPNRRSRITSPIYNVLAIDDHDEQYDEDDILFLLNSQDINPFIMSPSSTLSSVSSTTSTIIISSDSSVVLYD